MSGDGFEPGDYLEISSSIETSLKADADIRMKKHAAWMRCAVSRAYYSAFLSIRSKFEKDAELRKYLKESGNPHKAITDGLSADMKTHAHIMNLLREARNWCDYDLPPKFSVCTEVVEWANKQAKWLIACSSDMARMYDVRKARTANQRRRISRQRQG